MANNQNNVQPKVVTTTTTTTSRRGRRRRRRATRTPQAGTTTVRKVTTTRQPARPRRRRRNRFGASGKSAPGTIRQRITATLGTVGSNQGSSIEMEMSSLLNPLLMKETTGSNQYGPLQIHASTYNLWKLDYLLLKLTPMVGASAVSGTAIRASIDLSGQPGTPSWSALGARIHKDTSPGRPMTFYINGSYLKGPKEGWFYCNTKNDPKMCIAGAVQIHTLGKTMSTYTNTPFDAPLFLVELTGQWSFKNYNPQPGLLNLVKTEIKEEPQDIKIHSKPGEPILISIPEGSSMANAIGQIDVNADATPSEIIWQICDAAISTAIDLFPPPFTWLFKSGWWFVKRVANKKKTANNVQGEPNPGELTFQVYQSINDAQNDVPCISTGQTSTKSTTINKLQLMQITPGNVGMQQETISSLRRSVTPTLDPIQIISTPLTGQSALYGHIFTTVPNACVVAQQAVGAQKKVYTYTIWDVNRPVFLQNGEEVEPDKLESQPYPIFSKEGRNTTQIGTVYAAGYAPIGTSPNVYNWTTALWQATVTTQVKLQGNSGRTDRFVFVAPTQSGNPNNLPSTTYHITVTDQISMQQPVRMVQINEGSWYLSTFVAYGGDVEFNNYGVPYYFSIRNPDVTTTSCEPTNQAFDVGAVMQTSMPLTLSPPSTQNVPSLTGLEVEQLRSLLNPAGLPSIPPPPSEYDNLEMPPLEGDEGGEQGATGGYTPLNEVNQQRVRTPQAVGQMCPEPTLDIKNWVEFGHRKRPPTPFSPIEEEDEEDEDSDLDDDDYAEPPSAIRNLLTPEAKDLYGHLRQKGLSHEQATNAAQAAFPHLALEAWDAAYHNAMADGLSPPTARDLAWAAVSDFLS
ncbi:MAG: ORF2 [Sichuan mamastrovirus 12]|nr:MAG: ORF2 [Sichuan mamastrovirus 12]